jgi:hypothetical protein
MQKPLRSVLLTTGAKTVRFRIIFIQKIIHFFPPDGKEIKERPFHLLMKTEKAVSIAIQLELSGLPAARRRKIVESRLFFIIVMHTGECDRAVQSVLQREDTTPCAVAAVVGHNINVQLQPRLNNFRCKLLQDIDVSVFVVASDVDSLIGIKDGPVDFRIFTEWPDKRDQVCAQRQKCTPLKSFPEEIANLQEMGMNSGFPTVDNYPVIIRFFDHIEEITHILGFKAAGISVKRAEYTFVHTDPVDLELYHGSPGTDGCRVV